MSIKKSQAILKCFIDLKNSVYAGLRKRNHVLWHLELFSARLLVKVFKTLNEKSSHKLVSSRISGSLDSFYNPHVIVWFSWIFSICEIYGEYRDCRSCSVFNTLTGSRAEKVLSVTKHGFVFWAQRKPNTRLEISKAFQDWLTFLNRHTVW